jgi:NAD(P)H-hydrate repair Nnr-like enzyme with NAD(P)H-hydrate epimerase domain
VNINLLLDLNSKYVFYVGGGGRGGDVLVLAVDIQC